MRFLLLNILMLATPSIWAKEVPLSQMNVTEGASDARQLASGLIEVSGARFRATERSTFSNRAVLQFNYRGTVANPIPLESGEVRVQIGEKLLSLNPCNLVYVMWRIYPTESLVVSVKRDSGTTSAECGANGYTNVVPDVFPTGTSSASIPIPANLSARGGTSRTLIASYQPGSRILQVTIEGQTVWRGHLPSALVNGLIGPSGIRSDNGQFRFRFLTYKTRR